MPSALEAPDSPYGPGVSPNRRRPADSASVNHYPYSWIMPKRSCKPRDLDSMVAAVVTAVADVHGGTCKLARSRVNVGTGRPPVAV